MIKLWVCCTVHTGGRCFPLRKTIRLIVSFQFQKNLKVKLEIIEAREKKKKMLRCYFMGLYWINFSHFSNLVSLQFANIASERVHRVWWQTQKDKRIISPTIEMDAIQPSFFFFFFIPSTINPNLIVGRNYEELNAHCAPPEANQRGRLQQRKK